MAPRRRARQGVVLLLVLSLLVLFALLAMTFLIGAMRYRSGAEAFSQNDLLGDDPTKLADMAVYQVIREPQNPYSSLYGQSLLLDLYGQNGMGGAIRQAFTTAAPQNVDPHLGEIIRLDVQDTQFDTTTFGNPSTHQDYYAGSVITLLNGPAARQSSRIVRYTPATVDGMGNPVNARFYVEGFETNSDVLRQFINSNQNSVLFLINGKPFSGATVGYSIQNGGIVDPLTALSPHYGHYQSTAPTWSLPTGDANESYDALDHLNMFLAKNPPDPPGAPLPAIVGSFHRPQLIAYANTNAASWNPPTAPSPQEDHYRTFRRRFIFRPMPWDHPDFTGGNPNLTPQPGANGTIWSPGADMQPGIQGVDDDNDGTVDNAEELGWPRSDDVLYSDSAILTALTSTVPGLYDVDNDGDGFNDSFWLDLGFPVKAAKNGRLYKPLVALLIVDQDGRININAGGNLAQTQTGYHTGILPPNMTGVRPYGAQDGLLTVLEQHDNNGDTNVDRPAHGQGYGPAAINYRHLLDDAADPTDVDRYERVLLARYASAYDSTDRMPGSAGEDFLGFLKSVGRPDFFARLPNEATTPAPGANPYGSWVNPSAFQSPPDIFDRGTVALSHAGQPIWRYASTAGTIVDTSGSNLDTASERENHPYEMNLVEPTADDSPFTPAELERVLRHRDGDAGVLADRLYNLLQGGPTPLDELGKLITTHSSYIGSPPTVPLPPDNGTTDAQLFDILFPTDFIIPVSPNGPQPNPLVNNAARIAIRNVDTSVVAPAPAVMTGMTGVARMPTIIDLMAAKIVQGHLVGSTDPNPGNIPNATNGLPNTPGPSGGRAQLQRHLNSVLPFEFRRGSKMDPNRLWGNGQDDNDNDLVDEQHFVGGMTPYSWEVDGENIWSGTSAFGSTDYLNDDPLFSAPGGGGAFHPRGREMFARHLYCLMMLMVDLDYVPAATTFGEPQFPGFVEPYVDPTITTDVQRRELTIRRIAQWSVNAVDFRDADGIMTPFEYDVNPWNYEANTFGWAVDGNVGTDDLGPNQVDGLAPTIPPPAEAHPERRVVWGSEHPDLLITEAFAMHDRRVKDTEDDGGAMAKRDGTTPDPNLDQYRLPEGSLFIELYCPKRNVYSNTTGPVNDYQVAPQELYNVSAAGARLDVSRLAPADPGTGLQYPVWRMAISESYRYGPNAADRHGPLELIAAGKRDNISFQPSMSDQPDAMSVVTPADPTEIPPLQIDRLVWFAQQTPNPGMGPAFPTFEQNRVYYNRYGATELPAGEYLVVGPRAVTRVGSQDDAPDDMTASTPSEQAFRLVNTISGAPTAAFSYGDFGYPRRYGVGYDTNSLANAQVKPARTIIAAADPPTTWGPPGGGAQSLNETANVLAGTTETPIPGVGLSVSEPLRHQYYPEPQEFIDGGGGAYPLRDSLRDIVNDVGAFPDNPYDTDLPNMPIGEDNISETQRRDDYKTVFLQRLANPLLPWHPARNPYITVDWHPIDLTVFNGEDRERDTEPPGGQWDPDDNEPNPSDPAMTRDVDNPRFGSRERRGQPVFNVNTGLWYAGNSTAHTQAEDDPRPDDFFSLNARHSLGYLNRLVDNDAGHPNPPPMAMTTTDADDFVATPAHASIVGDPTLPFEWLNWNDRPYVSHLELMQVPASSPGRLLYEFVHRHPNVSNDESPYLPYDLTTTPPDANTYPYLSYRSSFGHLLNFFNTTAKTTGSSNPIRGANFYRLLDFVEVPSRFAGTEKWFNPDDVRNAPANANDVVRYRPPFNWISRFRDPGRVNINTIWDWRVWSGVSEGFPRMATQAFWQSNIEPSLQVNAGTSPSAYPNPVRAAGSAEYAAGLGGAPPDPLRHHGVEATLLRSTAPAATAATPRQPLLDNPNFQHFGSSPPAPDNLAIHPRPNPYFRYQGLQRLGNLVSGQSNVFAVWVTVGYFEVDRSPAGPDREHPDGFLLGQEVGSETGEIVRHRAFYMIDRSIPVGFQPGVNHNVEKTILLRRFIE